MRRSISAMFGLFLSFGLASGVHAQAMINVTDSSGLQNAINTATDGATITLAPGTYASPAGGFAINDRGVGFTIRAAAAGTVFLDGQNARDVVRFINSSLAAGGPVTFENLVFRNGLSATEGLSGGVTLHRARGTFINCVIQNNTLTAANTGGGGMLVAVGSVAHFQNVTWSGNTAKNFGGGLALEDAGSEATIHNSQFISNRTNLPNHAVSSGGGGIHVGNSTAGLVKLRVTNTRFEGNEAGYVGGGLFVIGSWQGGNPSIPTAEVIVTNSLFLNNKARKDASVAAPGPSEGGGFHAEDQSKARIYNSRFVTNTADTGGGVNLYRADVLIEDSVFQGNQAVGTSNSATGFGGAISAISNDVNDATTGGGTINRRSSILTVNDTLFHGRFAPATTVGQNGGCLYAAGDSNRLYGLNGATQMGNVSDNRATVTVTGSAFVDCDVVQTQPNTGRGGAVFVDLVGFSLTGSLVINSDALAGGGGAEYTAGGALEIINQSNATVTNSTLAKNTAACYGGAVLVQGATITIDGSRLVKNSVTGAASCGGTGLGGTMFSGPIPGGGGIPDLAVGGAVTNSTLSESTGGLVMIFDDDRNNTPTQINTIVYSNNVMRGAAVGSALYKNALFPQDNVPGLNARIVTRASGGNTDKGSGNTDPASVPAASLLLAVPPNRMAAAAPSEATPAPSYLAYGWGGPANATLNGNNRTGNAGIEVATSSGTQTLVVAGTSNSTDSVGAPAAPSALLSALPTSVSSGGASQLTWSTPNGTFLEATIDKAVGNTTFATGNANVNPIGTSTYRYFAVAQEGGAVAPATVTVTGGAAPTINFFTASNVLVNPLGASTLSWSVSAGSSVTLNGVGVSTPTGTLNINPGGTTAATLVATNAFGSTTRTVTVHVNDGTGAVAAPTVTSPANGQTVVVTGVGFTWSGVGGVSGYDIRVFDGSSGSLLFSGSLLGASSTSTLISLPAGSYRFAVRACSGGFTSGFCGSYNSVAFTVAPAAPAGAPTVTFPAQGANLTASTQTLSWSAVAPNSGMSYEVLLRDITAGTTALQITVPAPTLSTIFTMKSSTQYELKVRACQAGCGPYSPAVTFSVSLPPVPVSAPSGVSCSVAGGNSLTCNWNAVLNADAYQVQVVQAPPAGPGGGALTAAARQVSATTVTLPIPAGAATVFIAACNGNGCGPNAQSGINAAGPNPPQSNIGTPMAGTVVAGPGVLFTWNRVPGDNGSNTTYRLFVQDLSRQATALDVFTTSNFYSAFFKAEGARYDGLVISNPGLAGQAIGPSQGFNVAGSSATSPTMVSPPHNGTVSSGNIQLGWSPVPGATLYEYFVAVLGQGSASARGVTPGLLAQVPLTGSGGGTVYSGIVRACPAGNTCVSGSDAGWGPWSNDPGGPGVTNFTVVP